MRKYYRQHEASSEEDGLIDLTPLIDVVFVVLISFIVIAPLLKLDRIALSGTTQERLPLSPQSKSEIVIRVFKDDSITLNEEAVTKSSLSVKLEKIKALLPNETPKIYQDKQATFGAYQRVKDAVESAGFEEMDVILRSDHD